MQNRPICERPLIASMWGKSYKIKYKENGAKIEENQKLSHNKTTKCKQPKHPEHPKETKLIQERKEEEEKKEKKMKKTK